MANRSPWGLLVCIALALATAACRDRVAPPAAKTTVGVTLLSKTHPFYRSLEEAMRAAAAAQGVELLVQSAEFDVGAQTAQIENFITQKVAAIVVCPADSQAIGGAIKQANAAKIPVFTADIRADQVLFGAIFMGMLDNGLALLGMQTFDQLILKGVVLLAAVLVDQMKDRS